MTGLSQHNFMLLDASRSVVRTGLPQSVQARELEVNAGRVVPGYGLSVSRSDDPCSSDGPSDVLVNRLGASPDTVLQSVNGDPGNSNPTDGLSSCRGGSMVPINTSVQKHGMKALTFAHVDRGNSFARDSEWSSHSETVVTQHGSVHKQGIKPKFLDGDRDSISARDGDSSWHLPQYGRQNACNQQQQIQLVQQQRQQKVDDGQFMAQLQLLRQQQFLHQQHQQILQQQQLRLQHQQQLQPQQTLLQQQKLMKQQRMLQKQQELLQQQIKLLQESDLQMLEFDKYMQQQQQQLHRQHVQRYVKI